MTETKTLLPMDATRFHNGIAYDDFVADMENNQKRIKQMYDKYVLTTEDITSLEQSVAEHGGQLHISVMVEDWCPDVSLNAPIFAHVAEAVEGINLRLFVRSENPDLHDAYKAIDIYAIPTVTIFDANWEPIGHWAERSQNAHQQINQWITENHPNYEALGKSDDPGDKELVQKIKASRFATMLKWYRNGLWRDTLTEVLDILS